MQEKKIDGWIFLDKPLGLTSNQALQCVRRIFKNQKAGYIGTLDPLASGFLPIALGNATKTISLVEKKSKEYLFTIEWGLHTETGDLEGKVVKKKNLFPKKKKDRKTFRKFHRKNLSSPTKIFIKKN